MSDRILLNTPYPTLAETAKKYGISIAAAQRIADAVSRRLAQSSALLGATTSVAPMRRAARKGRVAVPARRRSKAAR